MRRPAAAALLAIAVFAAAQPAAAAPASEEELTRIMADRLRRALPDRTVRIVGPLQLDVAGSGSSEPTQMNLDRVWNVCRGSSEADCEAVSERFITAMQEASIEHPPIVSGQLRLMVRTADYCAQVRRLFEERGQGAPLARSGPADLCTIMVADYPTTMRMVRPDDLPALNLDADRAWALAGRQTLDALPDPPDLAFEEGGFAIVAGQDYTPSVILDEAGWRALAAARGPILMAVPEDGAVVIARAAEADPRLFRDAIRDAAAGAERPISSRIYRWTERGWAVVP